MSNYTFDDILLTFDDILSAYDGEHLFLYVYVIETPAVGESVTGDTSLGAVSAEDSVAVSESITASNAVDSTSIVDNTTLEDLVFVEVIAAQILSYEYIVLLLKGSRSATQQDVEPDNFVAPLTGPADDEVFGGGEAAPPLTGPADLDVFGNGEGTDVIVLKLKSRK